MDDRKVLEAIRDALFPEPRHETDKEGNSYWVTSDAGYNLMGVEEDLKHHGGNKTEVSTLGSVQDQIYRVKKLLEGSGLDCSWHARAIPPA